MFNLFRRNCLYNESIEPHCAYCAHCKPDNAYQGVCAYRGIVAMAGSCRRFEYDALRRKPPKPARIRGRFTDADFFFEEKEPDPPVTPTAEEQAAAVPHRPLISDDLSQFADLWEDDEDTAEAQEESNHDIHAPVSQSAETELPEHPEETQEETHEM